MYFRALIKAPSMLKNLAFTFVFILLSASVTLGQKRIFHAGLLGGISFAQVENDGLAHFSKLGFYGGGFISTDFTDIWEGEIGFTYVMKVTFSLFLEDGKLTMELSKQITHTSPISYFLLLFSSLKSTVAYSKSIKNEKAV